MPSVIRSEFVRQWTPARRVELLVPRNAHPRDDLPKAISRLELQAQIKNENSFRPFYPKSQLTARELSGDETLSDGIYSFTLRDAVVETYEVRSLSLPGFEDHYIASCQRNVLAAIKVGEPLDIIFDDPLESPTSIQKHHFPARNPNAPNARVRESGYGQFPIRIEALSLSDRGFSIISCFEDHYRTTTSRLPFFFGFAVAGTSTTEAQWPMWRTLLKRAMHEASRQRYAMAVLHATFAVESFIDETISQLLEVASLTEKFCEEIIVSTRLIAKIGQLINSVDRHYSQNQISRVQRKLQNHLFSPRNRIAHGRIDPHQISQSMATQAVKTAVEFVWDWSGEDGRRLLIPWSFETNFAAMIDAQLINACTAEEPARLG
ncbi:hypothetical protein [Stratiformator vulcanicus]|uniref:Uncharacterized protein n=1 Tax=Stratiformator vulcanicus TaxID=2527980 RepID=A0A517QX24_9PLAN|nr:hypothetical protein [Stratiformator vulcanicus]QDT36215.1 hypothetical protein Pan189_05700 [Stratiformator vulcanicus]